jgi:hypothetical protein
MANKPAPKTSKVAPLAVAPVVKPTLVPALVQTPVAVDNAPATKTPKTATRDACKEVRKDLDARATITPTDKAIDARKGSLRYNILEAIRKATTVVDACSHEVNGPGKHAVDPYTIKKVDVGFAIANGYITVSSAK